MVTPGRPFSPLKSKERRWQAIEEKHLLDQNPLTLKIDYYEKNVLFVTYFHIVFHCIPRFKVSKGRYYLLWELGANRSPARLLLYIGRVHC